MGQVSKYIERRSFLVLFLLLLLTPCLPPPFTGVYTSTNLATSVGYAGHEGAVAIVEYLTGDGQQQEVS